MTFLDRAPDTALARFGKFFRAGKLWQTPESAPDGQGGFTSGEPVSHACLALAVDYSDQRRIALGIPSTDRQVLILAKSLSVIPQVGNEVEAADMAMGGVVNRFDIIAKSTDPAGAVWELQVR